MKKRQFLHLGSSALAFFTTLKSVRGRSGAHLQSAKETRVFDRGLAHFLARTLKNRQYLFGGYFEAKYGATNSMVGEMEEIALKNFEVRAAKGSRRAQFYLGNIYEEIHWITKEPRFHEKARGLFIAAEAQGHPDATFKQIGLMPNRENSGQYVKAIRLGSVSALAACSGASHAIFKSEDWMKTGPILNFPEQVGMEWWSEVFFNWMIIHYFLIQWDPGGVHLRLSLPNDDLLKTISGQWEVEKLYAEDFCWEFLRERAEAAEAHASGINKDLYPEEIYEDIWDDLFRFKKRWTPK